MTGGWRNWRGNQAINRVKNASVRAVKKTGDVILAAAQNECPLDDGTLSGTGKVVMAGAGQPSCCITFGGGSGTGFPTVPYAIRWHQEQANFQYGKKRFYVRDPFNRLAKSTLQGAMRQEVGGVL